MSTKPPPLTPPALSIAEALAGSAPLARLRAALRDAQARLEAVAPLIPVPLRLHVRPGGIDEEGWTLLAANPSVAAKLRQLAPRFESRLREAGWLDAKVRIKVQTP
jgi:hypothetical protein